MPILGTGIALHHDFAQKMPELGVAWTVTDFPALTITKMNAPLAAELGLDADAVQEYLTSLSSASSPGIATAYSGHQFGHFNPQLGDGRALLLGEIMAPDGQIYDLHLKGSGRTAFSRSGDGKAALGPMLREYLMSQAMAALGIPTTRSLAVLTTGDQILREAGPLPGAILVRTAASHIRVGTFQYAALNGGADLVQKLADYCIARHFPACANAQDHEGNQYAAFFESVMDAQIRLVAAWMGVGFVHGVMNSDNMAISGETIDYGPCAFIDSYAPEAVFSSIDAQGRYAFANQPSIAAWNLARLAECLLPLLGEGTAAIDAANAILEQFADRYRTAWDAVMSRKIGIYNTAKAQDHDLIVALFTAMEGQNVDYTMFFRALAHDLATGEQTAAALFDYPQNFIAWQQDWEQRLSQNPIDNAECARRMNSCNPLYIPRNHLVEAALAKANDHADFQLFDQLLRALQSPFADRGPDWADWTQPAPAGSMPYVTYCGT